MGSRTRFFGTVLAMLALNTFYFRPTDPTEPTDPGETEPRQEQIDSPSDSPQSSRLPLEQVTQHWSRFSRALSSLWREISPDPQP